VPVEARRHGAEVLDAKVAALNRVREARLAAEKLEAANKKVKPVAVKLKHNDRRNDHRCFRRIRGRNVYISSIPGRAN
jgi:hypothetical protein